MIGRTISHYRIAAKLSSSLILGLASLLSQESGPAGSPKLTHSETEQFLTKAKVVKHRTIPEGVTAPLRATLSDGRITHDAQIQTIDVTRDRFATQKRVELGFRDTYKFNIAAHRLDQLLGLNMVPCSVERSFKGKPGAFTWWVDDVLMTQSQRHKKQIEPPDPTAWKQQLYVVDVFDELIYNMDRNLGNLLITKDWKLWMIDHTRAFRTYKKLRDPKKLLKCDRKLLASLRELSEESLTKELKGYLRRTEIQALLARRDAIVKHFDEQIAQRGEEALLYDLNRD
jgi:hypothetical protein